MLNISLVVRIVLFASIGFFPASGLAQSTGPSPVDPIATALSLMGNMQNLIVLIYAVGGVIVAITLALLGTIYRWHNQHKAILAQVRDFDSVLRRAGEHAVTITARLNVSALVDLELPEDRASMRKWISDAERSMSIEEMDHLIQYHLGMLIDLPAETFISLGHYHRYSGDRFEDEIREYKELQDKYEKLSGHALELRLVSALMGIQIERRNESFSISLRRYQEAARIAEKNEQHALESVAYQCRAVCLVKLGRFSEALAASEMALAKWREAPLSHYLIHEPNKYLLYDTHGLALAYMKRVDEAIVSFRTAVSMSDQPRRAKYNLVCALTEQGDVAKSDKDTDQFYNAAMEIWREIAKEDGVRVVALGDETIRSLRESDKYGPVFFELLGESVE